MKTLNLKISLVGLLCVTGLFTGCETTSSDSSPAMSGVSEDRSTTIPGNLTAALAEVEELGRRLYFHDQLAWKATDLVVEEFNGLPPGVRGWITVQEPNGWVVRFFGGQETLKVVQDVIFTEGGAPELVTPVEEALSNKDLLLIAARNAALDAVVEPCSPNYNTVVFEDEQTGVIYGYALAATTEPGKAVIGGHFRVTLSAETGELISQRRFTNTCLVLPGDDVPPGAQLAGLFMSHILDPHPVEIHVFQNLLIEIPFYVVTESGTWNVSDGEIKMWNADRRVGPKAE